MPAIEVRCRIQIDRSLDPAFRFDEQLQHVASGQRFAPRERDGVAFFLPADEQSVEIAIDLARFGLQVLRPQRDPAVLRRIPRVLCVHASRGQRRARRRHALLAAIEVWPLLVHDDADGAADPGAHRARDLQRLNRFDFVEAAARGDVLRDDVVHLRCRVGCASFAKTLPEACRRRAHRLSGRRGVQEENDRAKPRNVNGTHGGLRNARHYAANRPDCHRAGTNAP